MVQARLLPLLSPTVMLNSYGDKVKSHLLLIRAVAEIRCKTTMKYKMIERRNHKRIPRISRIAIRNKDRIIELEIRVRELEFLVKELKVNFSPDVIRAKAFIVENDHGNELVQIYEQDGNGCVSISDKDGHSGDLVLSISGKQGGRGNTTWLIGRQWQRCSWD